jgi:predicted GNAT family acetyltransferase
MLRQRIKEFEASPDPAMLYHTLKNKEGRAWVIEERGQIVAVAQSAAESERLAMIVGVCTHPAWRQRGYASACMARLCRALSAEGKIPCLFYDNPNAGRIYKRLGFEDFARWGMVIR